MKTTSLINLLYLAQRDTLNVLPNSKEMKEMLGKTIEIDDKIRKLIAPYPEIVALYGKLEQATSDLMSAGEENAYAHGFKAGLKIAVECGFIET